MARRHMDDPIAEQAIEWMVLLRSGEATQTDYDEYRRWRYENPLHERACQRIEQTLGKFQPLLAALPMSRFDRHYWHHQAGAKSCNTGWGWSLLPR